MWINTNDWVESTDNTQSDNSSEQTTEENNTNSEVQEVSEENVLLTIEWYKKSIEYIVSKVNEWDEEITSKQKRYVAWYTGISNDIWGVISEWWTDDFISSLKNSKEFIDSQIEALSKWLTDTEKTEVEEIVWTWASNDHEFDDITKKDKQRNEISYSENNEFWRETFM